MFVKGSQYPPPSIKTFLFSNFLLEFYTRNHYLLLTGRIEISKKILKISKLHFTLSRDSKEGSPKPHLFLSQLSDAIVFFSFFDRGRGGPDV